MKNSNNPNLTALTSIISALKSLDSDEQTRVLHAVATFLGISPFSTAKGAVSGAIDPSSSPLATKFSEDRTMSPKEFIREKMPRTDVERAACLAYYLTHYRETPHFKTIDISTLNTEAAQPKLANAAKTVNNAARAGFLVQATKGNKQLSAAGETFVQLLPDRDAAKASVTLRPRRKSKKNEQRKAD